MLIALVLTAIFVGVLVRLAKGWRSFWDRQVTSEDWTLGTLIALFAQVPLGIALLLLTHAIGGGLRSVLLSGLGSESSWPRWFSSLTGVVAVTAIGFASIALGLASRRALPAVRQLLILGGLWQVLFHLVLVPVVSINDESAWSAIYDLSTIPGLTWAAAVAHGFLLLQLWRWWSRRIRWDLRAIRWDRDARVRALETALRRDQSDVDARLRLATIWTGLGDLRRARRILDGAGTDGAAAQLARARLHLRQRRWAQALTASEAALASSVADEPNVTQPLLAGRGTALLELGRAAEAVETFDRIGPPTADTFSMRYFRGRARVAAGDVAGGHADLRAAVEALPPRNIFRKDVDALLRGKPSVWRSFLVRFLPRLIPPVILWDEAPEHAACRNTPGGDS